MSKWGLLASMVFGAAAAVGAGTAAPGLSAAEHSAKSARAATRSATAPMAHSATRAGVAATTGATTRAVVAGSQPADGWIIPPLTGNLGVLSTRSMFLHGRPPQAHAGAPAVAPPSMILRGVARQGEQFMALVEDVHAKQTRQMHVGDVLGPGKLVAITTDGVDRMLGGKLSHVKVGQPIDVALAGPGGPPGAPAPGPTTRPSAIAQQGPTDHEPSAGNAAPVTATAVTDPAAPAAAEVSTAGAKLIPGHE